MQASWTDFKPSERDELISLARLGKITPKEAEAEAAANGWEPFEQQPALPEFDPILESRWSIIMAVVWIVWRDLKLVRQNCPAFRSRSTYWIFREWKLPAKDGTEFAPGAGWFLELLREATIGTLEILEKRFQGQDRLPLTSQMTISEAKDALWRALGEGRLGSEALGRDGTPVDVPKREWSYLKLFEDGKQDCLRYDAGDPFEAFRHVKLNRDQILMLWPPPRVQVAIFSGLMIEATMFEPIARRGTNSFVPLCCALHWIMTGGGVRSAAVGDEDAWRIATEKLMPLIHVGEIDVIGLPRGSALTDRIPGHTLALLKVLSPTNWSACDVALDALSHIACSSFIGLKDWHRDHNDQLYVHGEALPAWAHLQLKKQTVLKYWPRPEPRAKPQEDCYRWLVSEMEQSPGTRAKPKDDFRTEAMEKFAPLSGGQFNGMWKKAIEDSGAASWTKAGRSRKSNR